MAMPPGGGSSWFHHSDTFQLMDDGGAVWAAVSAPVGRTSVTFMVPLAGSPWSLFHVFELECRTGRAEWSYHHGLLAQPKTLHWTADTPPDELVPYREIRERHQVWEHRPDAPVVATVEASAGQVTVRDSKGRARVHLRLGSQPDPAWPETGERGTVGAPGGPVLATFCVPTGPGTQVKILQTSLP